MVQERGWQIFATYQDEISAGVVAEYLCGNDCPAQISGAVSAELDSRVNVLVPGELMHRARWLWSQADVTEGELAYLATGKLPGNDQ